MHKQALAWDGFFSPPFGFYGWIVFEERCHIAILSGRVQHIEFEEVVLSQDCVKHSYLLFGSIQATVIQEL